MQYRFFVIPVADSEKATEELNGFLRGHRIIQVSREFVSDEGSARWCLCVEYLEANEKHRGRRSRRRKKRVDYKEVLPKKEFEHFKKLRECRRRIAQEEGIPAFAIFTDAQLADLVRLKELTRATMKTVKGVGEKKIERYGAAFISAAGNTEQSGEENG